MCKRILSSTMLNDNDVHHLIEFLEDIPEDSVMDIASNVTQRNILPKDREEAVSLIIKHSTSLESVLERKKTEKKFLINYLNKNGVSLTDWKKPILVRKLLNYWNTKPCNTVYSNDSNATSTTSSKQADSSSNDSSSSSANHKYYTDFCCAFSKWFYDIMNVAQMGCEHFFVDASLDVAICDQQGNSETYHSNLPSDIVTTLNDITHKFNLKYLPNTTPNDTQSINYRTDVHGVITMYIFGTLQHRLSSLILGCYEQMFVLIRDVNDQSNWKVKKTQLILRHSTATFSIEN